uniref:Rab proteins geranylgeranyltransferase component A p n=1 Tax=Albugo laibachii Nc14 TaxID=890382 RepID=F0WX77_9STRA|nr:rab proteins geranylgeranyltransferase component A p [Albugo laibachii Nc14]|eukprot:CCA26069.1 rab proteins geranylgeranyltransferase component A p [Albugo laibachii Nc14]
MSQSARFNLDIVSPKLLFAAGELVQLLISSGVGRYLEFTALERSFLQITTFENEELKKVVYAVPCSKKDVFRSDLLSVTEKRTLMKFLQFVADIGDIRFKGECLETKNERDLALGRSLKRPQNKLAPGFEDIEQYWDRPFEYLLVNKFHMSTKLQQVVLYCVAFETERDMADKFISAERGLQAVHNYVASIGRFANSAFLIPIFGVSELTQSFCRLGAVYGGIYVLRAPVYGFVESQGIDTDRDHVGVRTDSGILKGRHILVNGSYLPLFMKKHERPVYPRVLRAIVIMRASLRTTEKRFLVIIPPEDASYENPFAIHILQLDESAGTCPEGLYVLQISTKLPHEWFNDQEKSFKLMTSVIQDQLALGFIDEEVVLYQAIFTMNHVTSARLPVECKLPKNVTLCETPISPYASEDLSGYSSEIGFASAVANARAIFTSMFPDQPFLPKSAGAEQAEKEEFDDEQHAVLAAAQKLAKQATFDSNCPSSFVPIIAKDDHSPDV